MNDNTQQHDENPADGRSDSNGELGIKREMLISLRTFQDNGDGSFGVECIVSGLENQQQADRTMDFIQSAICGKEMSVN